MAARDATADAGRACIDGCSSPPPSRSRVLRGLPSCVPAGRRRASPAFAAAAARSSNCRRHGSIETTWALLISAAICYIPANMLPVLNTTTPQGTEGDTILGGVVFLYTSGSWPLALVVLIASVMIPLGQVGLARLSA